MTVSRTFSALFRSVSTVLLALCWFVLTPLTVHADWATLEDDKGILAYDYIEKDSGTANEYVNFKTDWTSWSSAEVWVDIGGSGFGYTASYVGDSDGTYYLDTDNPVASVNHANWLAGNDIDFYAKLNGADKDTKLAELLIIDVEKSDVSGIITNDGSKHVVLQFSIDVGTSSGRDLTRLWVENTGTLQEGTDISNAGMKLYYEVGTAFSFDGTEDSATLYGDYNENSGSNEQWGHDALSGIDIPDNGTDKLLCYVVIETISSGITYGRTAQFKIINNGISLDNFGTFAKYAVRIDEMQNANALAVGAVPTLSAGDIMFIGYNSDGDDDYEFVALTDIPTDTTIYFTDAEWGGASMNSESWQEWNSGASVISAGTVVQVSDCNTGDRTVSHGSLPAGQTMNLENSNEGLWAYQGAPGIPTEFLTYISNEDLAGTGNSLDNTGLTAVNATIEFTGDEDIMEYTGPRTGQTAAGFRALVADIGNWTTADSSGDQSGSFLPFDSTAFVLTVPPGSPTATAATAIDTNGFTANWNTVSGADDYRLDVSTASNFMITVLSESFAGFTGSGSTQPADGDFENSGADWLREYVYENTGNAKLGTSGDRGILTTPEMDLSGEDATVTFNAAGYGGDDSGVVIQHVAAGSTTDVQTISLTESMTEYQVTLSGGTAASRVQFYASNKTSERFYLDNITITHGETYVTSYSNKTVSGTTTLVTGLNPATTYFYRLRAVNVGGASGSSETIMVLTLPVAPAASAATNVQDTSFYANWQAIDGAVGYELDVASDSGFASILASYDDLAVGAVTTKLVTTGIAHTSDYYYRVRATNASGASANSGTVSVGTIAPEPASNPTSGVSFANPTPTTLDLNLSGAIGGDGSYTIVVCAPDAYPTSAPLDGATYTGSADFTAAPPLGDGKVIYVGAANPAEFTMTNLTTGITYYLNIYNFNGSGGRENYRQTAPETKSNTTRPPAPTGVIATDDNTAAIVVSWSAATGATKYRIHRNTGNTITGATQVADDVTGLTYSDTSATRNITYYYFIQSKAGTTLSAEYSESASGIRVSPPTLFLFR